MENELDIVAQKYGTDKHSSKHHYTQWYNKYFRSIRNDKLNILEIGIARGRSVLMWKEYFKNSNIFCIDIVERKKYKKTLSGIKYFIGDASDDDFLLEVNDVIKGGLDIIIDDGSHVPEHQISSFDCLFTKLNNGGIYVIEDMQTSYRKEYSIHGVSSVEYFKNIVDDVNFHGKNKHQNIDKVKIKTMINANEYEKTISSIHFYMGICFIFKR